MTIARFWILVAVTALLCLGCSLKEVSLPKVNLLGIFQTGGEQALSAGVKSYEEGNYGDASQHLREALDKGLRDKADQVKAYKYRAFIQCASGHMPKCEREFKNALRIDPTFELQPAEAGHPVWGPVFRKLKAKAVHPQEP